MKKIYIYQNEMRLVWLDDLNQHWLEATGYLYDLNLKNWIDILDFVWFDGEMISSIQFNSIQLVYMDLSTCLLTNFFTLASSIAELPIGYCTVVKKMMTLYTSFIFLFLIKTNYTLKEKLWVIKILYFNLLKIHLNIFIFMYLFHS